MVKICILIVAPLACVVDVFSALRTVTVTLRVLFYTRVSFIAITLKLTCVQLYIRPREYRYLHNNYY